MASVCPASHPKEPHRAEEAFEHFFDEGLIEKVLRPIKSGKEATVHLCRANPSTTGAELAALKVFHPLDRRDFRDESLYRDGEFIKERRIHAVLQRTKFGREVQGGIWVRREWESLKALSAAGVSVPRPIESTGDAIMMTYIGDETFAAPQLHAYRSTTVPRPSTCWTNSFAPSSGCSSTT